MNKNDNVHDIVQYFSYVKSANEFSFIFFVFKCYISSSTNFVTRTKRMPSVINVEQYFYLVRELI